ncbi:hypothetical protein [Modestobacter sp. SSW1-42]|uniref:hypothetical protein n=1 Tax=Modestobacter sp. SSW1-42 TaxID=596372 RepID=UPI003986F661
MGRTPSGLLITLTAATVVGGGLVAGAGAASAAFPGQVLDQLVVAPEYTGQPYDPDAFQHWVDADGDGCDTRAEVLIAESFTPATVGPACQVGGRWVSFLDGQERTDPARVEIDHLVALEEAWQSGAAAWTAAERRAFANDLDHVWSLNAVTDTVHAAKGPRDPAEWLPPATAIRCTYAQAWIGVKYRWHLSVDPAEKSALGDIATSCGSAPMEVPPRADVPDPTTSPAETDRMTGGQTLTAGQWLMSADRTHGLTLQADGNLVAYGPNSRVLWNSRTYGNPGAVLRMQTDGNLVVYAASGAVLWHAGTYGNPGATLEVQDDGNVVLYRADRSAAWYTGWDRTSLFSGQYLGTGQQVTSANGRYHLVLQPDGNVVVYTAGGRPLFFTGSYGAFQLLLQADGNLVAYNGVGYARWDSGTWREGFSRLDVQDDGNVVLYRADGTPSWYSGWDAGQTASSPSRGTHLPRPLPGR